MTANVKTAAAIIFYAAVIIMTLVIAARECAPHRDALPETGSFDVWAVCTRCGVRIPVARIAAMRQIKYGAPIPCPHCREGRAVPQRKPHAEDYDL